MSEELKACPFCGCEDIFIDKGDFSHGYSIYCQNCYCGTWHSHRVTEELNSLQDAIETWNRRVNHE